MQISLKIRKLKGFNSYLYQIFNFSKLWDKTYPFIRWFLPFDKNFEFHVGDAVSKFCRSIGVTIHNHLWSFSKFLIGIVTSRCRDHHDIIIYPLINKEFFIKKFSNQLAPISFYLLDRNTYSSIFTGVC